MKVLEYNSGIYGDHHESAVYDLFITALSLGYTHVVDVFMEYGEPVSLDCVVNLLNFTGKFDTCWGVLDEATRVDLGDVRLTHSTTPVDIKTIWRSLDDEEKKDIPEFFHDRLKTPTHLVLYHQEPYIIIMNKIDLMTSKKVYKTIVFTN